MLPTSTSHLGWCSWAWELPAFYSKWSLYTLPPSGFSYEQRNVVPEVIRINHICGGPPFSSIILAYFFFHCTKESSVFVWLLFKCIVILLH